MNVLDITSDLCQFDKAHKSVGLKLKNLPFKLGDKDPLPLYITVKSIKTDVVAVFTRTHAHPTNRPEFVALYFPNDVTAEYLTGWTLTFDLKDA